MILSNRKKSFKGIVLLTKPEYEIHIYDDKKDKEKQNTIEKPHGDFHVNQNCNQRERQDNPLHLILDGTLKQDTQRKDW